MVFSAFRDNSLTMKEIILHSFFPFSGLYSSLLLKPIEQKHMSDSLCIATHAKDAWSFISSSTSPIWLQIRNWWYDYRSPSSSSDMVLSNWSSDFQTTTKPKVDLTKIIQLLVSVVGIGISLRLMFYLIEQINPTLKEKRECRKRAEAIFKNIGLKKTPCLNDYEACIAVNLVDPHILSTTWDSIGAIKIKHSLPVNSRLLRPPKGILLYGPPGCGKTLLARAMARAAHANFINLQIATLVNMWYGETQKYVEATFSLAEKIQPTIIFIDELDSFLTTRSQMDNEATRMIKTQFMALWDGLLTQDNTQIIIVGATNRPGDLDQAILRRLPYKIKVPLPNTNQRNHILKVLLKDDQVAKALSEDDLKQIADKTEGLSGNDLSELCREAAFICLRSLRTGDVQTDLMLTVDHFTQALQKYMNHRIKPEPVDSSISHCPCDEQTASDKKWSRRRNTGKCLL
ncbi:unnamed protein product [Heterobilharzia americana]|nr:unnamed protein product [Heterobilharzia americana]